MQGIPKIIHYCWFGRGQKPESVLAYIRNWREMLPDFEIIEWNEDNFDIGMCPYIIQAYAEKKYAFVSDVARLYALYEKGGVYLDTDVEIKKNLTPLLSGGMVLGFEECNYVATSTIIAPAGHRFLREFLALYMKISFYNLDGSISLTTNVVRMTEILVNFGLIRNGMAQSLFYFDDEIKVLDQMKFSPLDYINGIDHSDGSTFTMHHFGQSWVTGGTAARSILKAWLQRLIGGKGVRLLRRIIKFFVNNVPAP